MIRSRINTEKRRGQGEGTEEEFGVGWLGRIIKEERRDLWGCSSPMEETFEATQPGQHNNDTTTPS